VLMAPAMHTEMWEHPATRANVATLRERGVHVLDPDSGRLTGADTGRGRLPHPDAILEAARDLVLRGERGTDLAGRHVVVSAGGTREALDPVRFLGNRSSGRQGQALAVAALGRGARVTLVRAHVDLPTPAGVEVVEVDSTGDLRDAVLAAASDADAVVMAAAPADFTPAAPSATKIKKTGDDAPSLELVQTPDVLRELAATRPGGPGQVVVGFAAETGSGDDGGADVLALATDKLRRKGCDLLVLNDVGDGRVFGRPDTEAVVLAADGSEPHPVPTGPKGVLAHAVWDAVAHRLPPS
jgi:phosphopantothenoylcysteine decarboxylase / phosphopantothenate---cysteine ligase